MVIYEKRWNIEVLFKELRVSLGLGDYQVLSRSAIERHLHLSCLAHLTLTHHGLDAVGAKAKQNDKEVTLPPMHQRLNDLRASIHRDQIKVLLKRIRNPRTRTAVREFLSELHLAA